MEAPLLLIALTPRATFLLLVARRAIVARAERLIRSWGLVAVGLRPIGPVMAAAGAGGLAVRPVAVANLLGTAAQAALIYQGSRSAPFPALLAAAVAVAVAGLAAGAVRRLRSSPVLAARRVLPASP